jgi:hypothetical protein
VAPPVPTGIGLGFTPESRLFVPDPGRAGYMTTNPNKAVSPIESLLSFLVSGVSTVPFRSRTLPLAKPKRTFRIFFLGESSANYAQPRLQSMAQRLEERFPRFNSIELINCGGCAYGRRLVFILSQVLQYEPDAIFLYLGRNAC